jgi:hypothetical protein
LHCERQMESHPIWNEVVLTMRFVLCLAWAVFAAAGTVSHIHGPACIVSQSDFRGLCLSEYFY